MIVPSIDIMNGRAVQLRHGREFVLDAGDPLEWLERFCVAGEVAVVDLDAALGRGSNADLIRTMVRRASCRVGGGIRNMGTARAWLDAGASRIVIGTAANPELCAALPRERVIAAVDALSGNVVVEGWRHTTGMRMLDAIQQLAPHVGGFLFTQVEREGALGGFDMAAVHAAVEAAGTARVTAAGGITTAEEIAALDRISADAQIGMALYTGVVDLGDAIAAPMDDELWPTIVCDETGRALGLAWSSRESLRRAVAERRGIYWSRSRREIWVKGETSGNTQHLLGVDADCDRDTLRFTVRQEGTGFCHRGTRTCFRDRFDLGTLMRVLNERREARDPASRTSRLLDDPDLLASKLGEEAVELARAATREETIHEAADVTWLVLTALARAGAGIDDLEAELARRHRAVTRRPLERKT